MDRSPNGSFLLCVAASGAQGGFSLILLDPDLVSRFPRSIPSPSSSENTCHDFPRHKQDLLCPTSQPPPSQPYPKTRARMRGQILRQHHGTLVLPDSCKENVIYPHLLRAGSLSQGTRAASYTSCSPALQEEHFKEQ